MLKQDRVALNQANFSHCFFKTACDDFLAIFTLKLLNNLVVEFFLCFAVLKPV